jgi:8-oxo-dGTP diphosphatase
MLIKSPEKNMKLATLCYITDKTLKKTLMLHRIKKINDYHQGKWNGLGGKFDPGESPEDCVIREVKEESGLDIINPRLNGFITFPLFDGTDDWYVFIFTATNFKGRIIDSNEGKLEWIPNDDLFSLNLWDGDKIFIKWLLQDKFFSAKFIYENGHYLDHQVIFY